MQQINFKASLRLTTHTITEECTEATFSWHQWIQLKKEQLSDVSIFFQKSKLLFKCFSYRMAGLQGCWEYYAHRCCQNEHSLLSQFTPWLEIGENCLQVIQFVICLFLITPWKLLHTGYFGIKQKVRNVKNFFLLTRTQTSNDQPGQPHDQKGRTELDLDSGSVNCFLQLQG